MSERTYRRQSTQTVQFARFNQALVGHASQGGGALLGVMDCSFVGKSGKATFGLDSVLAWHQQSSRTGV